MWQRRRKGRSSAFGTTLVELMTALFVALFVVASVWSVYLIVWKWWHETAPRIEAQRMARIAVLAVINGVDDTTAGTYTVNSVAYTRKNGITWATTAQPGSVKPSIPSAGEIDFALVPDITNARAFKLDIDPVTSRNAVRYRNDAGTWSTVAGTVGIKDLTFAFVDSVNKNLVQVTVTAEKNVEGVRSQTYTVSVTYVATVYLRNV